MFEIGVTKTFDAAHCLRNYQGKCANIHGHTWRVDATVGVEGLNELGIAFDFTEFKIILKEVIGTLDHQYLNDLTEFKEINPTAENISVYVFKEIANRIPSGVKVLSVRIWESPTSNVTYKGLV